MKDVNDWFVDGRGAEELIALIESRPAYGKQRDPGQLLEMAYARVKAGESRNTTGLWLACQMRDEQYTMDDAWELAVREFQRAVTDQKAEPYSEQEARDTLDSAYSQPPRSPSGRSSASGGEYKYPLTELGNAERFTAQHGNDCRYIPPFNRWVLWDSRRWIEDLRGQVPRWVKQSTRMIRREAFAIEDDDEQKKQLKWGFQSESAAKQAATLKLAQNEEGMSMLPSEFDTDPMLLNANNGTLDLRTGELRDHRREDNLRRMIDVAYDPDAESPMFQKFLEQIQPDPKIRAFIQRAIGYSLTGRTDEQKFILAHGSGGNGKSVLMELIHDLMGDYATFLPAEALATRSADRIPNDIARLDGARFVTVMEFDDTSPLNERVIKQLTGGDTMQARFMRGEFFDFRPQCTLWISSNHRPVVKGADDGIWRRFLLVDFPVKIPKDQVDPMLRQRIRDAELPGILVWAVEGALAWQREGLNPPASVLVATDGYRADSDLLGTFLAEECVVGPTETIAKGLIYDRYKIWCQDGNLRPATKIAFGRMLRERPSLTLGEDEVGKQKVHTWLGITLQEHRNLFRVGQEDDAPVTPISGGSKPAGPFGPEGASGSGDTPRPRRKP